jgi:DNA-binding GntR family transcriptional regulator
LGDPSFIGSTRCVRDPLGVRNVGARHATDGTLDPMPPKRGRNLSTDQRFASVVNQLAGGYKTMGQMVYAVLREAILAGAFAPGEWLRQESLAVAIGVSRIPVRTALLQLESEGLVTFHPHRGARVRTLKIEQINEIYRLRTLLESYALTLSMQNISKERIAALKALARQLDKQPEAGELVGVRVQFYRALYDAENNPLLVQLIEELRSRCLLDFRPAGKRKHAHAELVDHVAGGDQAGAKAWLQSYLEQVRQGMVSPLEDDSDVEAGYIAGEAEELRIGSPTSRSKTRPRAKT